MRRTLAHAARAVVAFAALLTGAAPTFAQSLGLITQPVNEAQRVTLAGNTRPEANAATDRGSVPDSLPIAHMLLLLRRPPAHETALDQTIDDLQDPNSPEYHRWLSAAEFGARFGAAAADLAAITGWLASQGFQINGVYPNGMTIDFSGTARQVRTAFHTAIHYLDIGGVTHIANISDPQIRRHWRPPLSG